MGRQRGQVEVEDFKKEFRRSRRPESGAMRAPSSFVIPPERPAAAASTLLLLLLAWPSLPSPHPTRCQVEALRITSFRVPAYVPITLQTSGQSRELTKPILFDCDYDYEPGEDTRLAVRWFRNKEPEPFYQWLPELNVRHLADWIKPLVNQTFISDPREPMKRYRSLLIKRLSMELTGQYTCLVSSLASQDLRQASLVIYQPPRSFTFEHRIFPAPAPMAPAPRPSGGPAHLSHTHFKGLPKVPPVSMAAAAPVRPPNNNNSMSVSVGPNAEGQTVQPPVAGSKIVYTHDGRPVRRRQRRQAIAGWQLSKKQVNAQPVESGAGSTANLAAGATFALQLHHFQCQASQVTPRPVIVLTVKRGADSIAQYLHESSSTSIRPYQVSHAHYLAASGEEPDEGRAGNVTSGGGSYDEQAPLVTLYDITVSATVALNVSLPPASGASVSGQQIQAAPEYHRSQVYEEPPAQGSNYLQSGMSTVLSFRRGQRMSFECHLEITGTEFEQRKRININEEEVFRFAETEELRRQAKLERELGRLARNQDRNENQAGSSIGLPAGTQAAADSPSNAGFSSSSAPGKLSNLGPGYWRLCALFAALLFWRRHFEPGRGARRFP